jgi:hypothetical protein
LAAYIRVPSITVADVAVFVENVDDTLLDISDISRSIVPFVVHGVSHRFWQICVALQVPELEFHVNLPDVVHSQFLAVLVADFEECVEVNKSIAFERFVLWLLLIFLRSVGCAMFSVAASCKAADNN